MPGLEELMRGLIKPAGEGGTVLSSPLASLIGLGLSVADTRFASVFESTVLKPELARMKTASDKSKALSKSLLDTQKMNLQLEQFALKLRESGQTQREKGVAATKKKKTETGVVEGLQRFGELREPGPTISEVVTTPPTLTSADLFGEAPPAQPFGLAEAPGRAPLPPRQAAFQALQGIPQESQKEVLDLIKGLPAAEAPQFGEVPEGFGVKSITQKGPGGSSRTLTGPSDQAQALSTDKLLAKAIQEGDQNTIDAIQKAKTDPIAARMLGIVLGQSENGEIPGGFDSDSFTVKSGAFSLTFKKPGLTAGERDKLVQTEAIQFRFNQLQRLYNQHGKSIVGPIAGRGIDALYKAGGQIAGVGLSPGQSQFVNATQLLSEFMVKLLQGARPSDKDVERIMLQLPKVTDAPSQYQAKLDLTKDNFSFLKKKLEGLKKTEKQRQGTTQETTEDRINRLRGEAGLR